MYAKGLNTLDSAFVNSYVNKSDKRGEDQSKNSTTFNEKTWTEWNTKGI